VAPGLDLGGEVPVNHPPYRVASVVVLFGQQPSDRGSWLANLPGDEKFVIANGTEAAAWATTTDIQPCVVILQPDNPGLAVSYNEALLRCSVDWLLLIDQDSDFVVSALPVMLQAIDEFAVTREKIGIVTGVLVDRATGTNSNRSALPAGNSSPHLISPPRFQNSGSLISVAAAKDVGGWCVHLALDLVDAEFGVRLRKFGWAQLQVCDVVLHHQLGLLTSHRIGPVIAHATNHSVERRFELGSSVAILVRIHGLRDPGVQQTLRHVLGNLLGMVLFESERLRKLFAFVRGVRVGVRRHVSSSTEQSVRR
jgi:GT2 family glycosyltransferase